MTQNDWPELINDSIDRWNKNAQYWDATMGDSSNNFHNLLVRPATERLFQIQPGEHVLDIGCGNGNFSRRLAELGAHVVATDSSPKMIECAQARTKENLDRIAYRVVDATDLNSLLSLGTAQFGAAVANMVLMDMACIGPLLSAVCQLLKPKGRFVYSICHPCFQSPGAVKFSEEEDQGGTIKNRYGVKIIQYINPTPFEGCAIVNQPVPQYYFHRPLSALVQIALQAGFLLDGLEEPVFDNDSIPQDRIASWGWSLQIPPVLVVRLKKINEQK